ncbi:glycoside hydrolase family 9 protein [Parabacteroides sp. PF5-9]|uniref:glycoside hydrolase family 9 protein n=1 Tax=Parabacteroides sp. PF5-9 TaxID=1742404 RepID=UPI00247374B2|nr:glycoside hydrolase family 9 protein [Parabacteroides sp. PF5-9]MDH6358280.1 endoglucanase [Parabacteroides sp. PF5-9]
MKKHRLICLILLNVLFAMPLFYAQGFKVGTTGYFQEKGVEVMAFDDIYPEGHQGGVSLIMHGNRVATNGDIRFEPTPGQWQPVPKQRDRKVDPSGNTITAYLSYPDTSRHMTGFNPMIYPDLVFNYTVTVKGEGGSVIVTVDLDRPIPQQFLGKVGFNLELFPGALFGKPWIMDSQTGIFPQQPNGPTQYEPANHPHRGNFNPEGKASAEQLTGKGYSPMIADDIVAEPYAIGKRFVVRPDDPYNKYTIETKGADLKLYDGRMNHNNGWFVVRSEVPAGKTKGAIQWVITPNVVNDWLYKPVVQTSQIGYHPNQPKAAIIELDKRDYNRHKPTLYKITSEGEREVAVKQGEEWGQFLRYNYLKFDFSDVNDEGLYQVRYGDAVSSVFRIAKDVYDRGVWQPVLEYFLPVQMCHMRINEKYRVWHDYCHMDDARMAPVDFNHIDGYVQGVSTLTKYNPGDVVPGLNIGGWHDAGDFDLRVESQAGETYILTLAYEAFDVDYDVTSIDQLSRITEIHQPDGKPDLLQQIENGALTVVGGYRALGRLYRGIITEDLRRYVLLGDAAAMTDNVPGNEDDRWVFTENNPSRELTTAAQMAAASRVLKGFNDTLSVQSLQCARELFDVTEETNRSRSAKVHAATELYLTTGEDKYKKYLLDQTEFITGNISRVGWFIGRAEKKLNDAKFTKAVRNALEGLRTELDKQGAETPYGIPYRPHIWGAGWNIQSFGYNHYFLHTAYPDIFGPDYIYNALNFILGCHPGSNTSSFASGVGAVSATVGYGLNRADWSYIPGGVVSGTALIRPDFPELLEFPYLWQQVEYVMGGGSSHYMFLVLAAQQLLSK